MDLIEESYPMTYKEFEQRVVELSSNLMVMMSWMR